jgi:uncharacterized protein with PQ loop repeat
VNKLGGIGGILLALCALPQAWECYTTQSASGLSWGFLGMWGGGEAALLVSTYDLKRWYLTLNYGVNVVLVGYMLTFKLFL